MSSLSVKRLILTLIMAVAIIAGLLGFGVASISSEIPALQDFSARRAFDHIESICGNPHPMGSAEIERVREFIVNEITSLGLEAQIQEAQVPDYFGINNKQPVTIKNVFATIPGIDSSGSIVIAGHYDTVPASPGANDDGSAVATLLETARALLSGKPLRNDVIILFTDAEEPGQYRFGANLFITGYESLDNIRLVLNFEALGCTGPSIMFETAPGNEWLIEGLARGSNNPVAFSFMTDLYRLIAKGGTDFAAFEEAGINGLNFAYSFERTGYHTALDNIESVDLRSLQHHGDYALNLSRYFGELDLLRISSTERADYVYHALFASALLNYPASAAVPLVLIAGAVLIFLVVVAFRKSMISIPGIVFSIPLFLGEVLVVSIALTLAWWGIDEAHLSFGTVVEPGVKAHLLFAGFVLLALIMVIMSRTKIFTRLGPMNRIFGTIVFWWILAALSSMFLTGFNVILVWPLIFSLLPLGWAVVKGPDRVDSWLFFACLSVSALVAIGLMTTPIYLLFQAMGTSSPGFSGSPSFPIIGISIFFLVLLLGIIIPHLRFLVDLEKPKLVLGLLGVAAVFMVLGCRMPGLDIANFGLPG